MVDKVLEKKVRDQIARDVNNMIRNKLRVGSPLPMYVQVALSELLAEGKRACQFSSIPFSRWIKESIKLAYEECKRLAAAGASKDPAKYIIARREKNRIANVRYRKRKKVDANTSEFIKRRFDKLPKPHKIKFLKDIHSDFPPFDDYDEEAAEIVGKIERRIDHE